MSRQSRDRRIIRGFDKADKIFAGRTYSDLGLFLGVPLFVGGFLLLLEVISGGQFLLSMGIVLVINFVLLRKIPDDESIWARIRSVIWHLRSPSVSVDSRLSSDGGVDIETEYILGSEADDPITKEDLSTSAWESPPEDSNLLGIAQIHTEYPIVEREDGVFVGAVRVEGRDVSLLDAESRESTLSRYGAQLNSLDFSPETHIITDSFDLAEHLDQIENRLSDQDLQERPILRDLMQSHLQRMQYQTGTLGAKYRKTYEVVTVDPAEQSDRKSEGLLGFIEPDSPVGRLLDLEERRRSVDERKRRQAGETLLTRLDSLATGLSNIDQKIEVTQLSGEEVAQLVTHRWRSQQIGDTEWEPQSSPITSPGNSHSVDTGRDLQT